MLFEQLEQQHAQPTRPQIRAVDLTVPSPPARYPPLARATTERFYALGWKISEEWLKDFARRTCSKARIKHTHSLIVLGLVMLKRYAKYEHMNCFVVIPDNVPLTATGDDSTQPILAI
ncbi:hypothetical protein SCP_1303280 [Sparassis crispa]|uniref:Uncharacterized protein n=1 Tax=Sparassis crispa TaxID=139825 RepID=A0A401H295_9APHY|nr:hypothetical protein SCP_1303280 [Sparassis crispa]GBE88512.1 hypothetical protein SCP_1303280 [Sparassis crispa]